MKRLAALLCLLLLAACGNPRASEAPTQAPLRAYGHALEQQTGGALEVFPTEQTGSCSLLAFGDRLVLAQADTVRLYEGPDLSETARSLAGTPVGCSSDCLWVYSRSTRQLSLLDRSLSPTSVFSLPEDTLGLPCPSQDRKQLYLLKSDGLYVLDPSTGSAQVLRDNMAVADGSVTCLEDGNTLLLHLTDPTGTQNTLLVSAADGSALFEDLAPSQAAVFPGGTAIVSTPGWLSRILLLSQSPQRLDTREGETFGGFLAPISGVVTAMQTDPGLELRLYDLSDGLCRSSVTLPGMTQAADFCITDAGELYFLARREDAPWTVLRWHWEDTPSQDGTNRLLPYSQSPTDWEQARSARLAGALEAKYGLTLRLYGDAVRQMPWDYTLTPCLAADETDRILEALDPLLAAFPEGFFPRLQQGWEGLSLCLAGSIRGSAAAGSLSAAQGLQFQEDGQYYVVLASAPPEELRYTLFHEFFHLMDAKMDLESLSSGSWQALNPAGFSYGAPPDPAFLSGQGQAFVDAYAMSGPAEDRARIFECAANPGNAALFAPPIMQQKLRQICADIRTAFDLESDSRTYIWEQYLTGSP